MKCKGIEPIGSLSSEEDEHMRPLTTLISTILHCVVHTFEQVSEMNRLLCLCFRVSIHLDHKLAEYSVKYEVTLVMLCELYDLIL